MGDTEVWLKHARRKEICGVGSDIPSEPKMFIIRPLADLTVLYRILSVAKSVVLSGRGVRININCQFIKYMCRLYRAHQVTVYG
jgi:hypothetical protein